MKIFLQIPEPVVATIIILIIMILPAAVEVYGTSDQPQLKEASSVTVFKHKLATSVAIGDTVAIEVQVFWNRNRCKHCTECPIMRKDFLAGIKPKTISKGTLIYEKGGRAYVLAVRVK